MGDEPASRTTMIIMTVIVVAVTIAFVYACAKGAVIV